MSIGWQSAVACAGRSGEPGAWKRLQDIDYLASELPRLHPNLFFKTPRGEYDAVVAAVRAAAPRDGHTSVFRWRGFGFLPLALAHLSGGLYVVAADASCPALGRVVAIGEVGVAELDRAPLRERRSLTRD